jgi:hypothetical protein
MSISNCRLTLLPVHRLSQEGFQALVLVPEVLLDIRSRLAFGRFHLLQVRFKNRFPVREHLQEAPSVSGTCLPTFANEYVRHIPPPAQVKQPQQVGAVSCP